MSSLFFARQTFFNVAYRVPGRLKSFVAQTARRLG
jgi:hypothetical protein